METKRVKAFGNGGHVILPAQMVGKEVYIMDDKTAKKYIEIMNDYDLDSVDTNYIRNLIKDDSKKN